MKILIELSGVIHTFKIQPIPRVNEYIRFESKLYTVMKVIHNLTSDSVFIETLLIPSKDENTETTQSSPEESS